jgi:hypothetical protein
MELVEHLFGLSIYVYVCLGALQLACACRDSIQ